MSLAAELLHTNCTDSFRLKEIKDIGDIKDRITENSSTAQTIVYLHIPGVPKKIRRIYFAASGSETEPR